MGPTVFNLFWTPPLTEHRNGLIRGYVIQVTELETGRIEQFNTTDKTIVIYGRHPFYRYSYVIAAESIGPGPYSVASLIHMPEAGNTDSKSKLFFGYTQSLYGYMCKVYDIKALSNYYCWSLACTVLKLHLHHLRMLQSLP